MWATLACPRPLSLLTFLPKDALFPCQGVATHGPELDVLHTTRHQGGGGARGGAEVDVKYPVPMTPGRGHDLATPPVPHVEGVMVIQTN